MGRKAVGCDINDMPVFISKTLLSVNNTDGLKAVLNDFLAKLAPLEEYYQTTCPLCHQTGMISKFCLIKWTGRKIQ